ncbi:MAG: SpoIID/LytB domain-containing protein [Bacteroidota bacterium]|nr:SpoIID/LytB domain-containing protein [Bacteroidota bacterium]
MTRSRLLAFALFIIIAITGCASMSPTTGENTQPFIRVCVAERSTDITLRIGEGSVLETATRTFSLEGHEQLRCALEDDGAMTVFMDGKEARSFRGAFRCYSRNPGTRVHFEDRSYGDTLLLASDGRVLYLVNILPLESYLKGVVPHEIGRNRTAEEIEAVRAQAILARTYALRKISLPLTRLFDVYDDTRDQVFAGADQGDDLASVAVDQTRGRVIAFNGQLAECYYHSTCGGRSEASSLVWQRPQSQPWLVGVRDRGRDGDYCRISPSYRWSVQYERLTLENMLRTFLPAANDAIREEDLPRENWHLLDLNIIKRMPSGRVATLQVVMGNRARQRAYYVHGDNVRKIFRGEDDRPLRSALIDIDISRDRQRWIRRVRIDGGGSGHGVGMCQWGAIGRAREGDAHSRILHAYFPGTQILRLY